MVCLLMLTITSAGLEIKRVTISKCAFIVSFSPFFLFAFFPSYKGENQMRYLIVFFFYGGQITPVMTGIKFPNTNNQPLTNRSGKCKQVKNGLGLTSI
jgi:hypothetical protein